MGEEQQGSKAAVIDLPWESPLPVKNWKVHIQVVRNNAVDVPFQFT